MNIPRWTGGRQGGGYEKLTLFAGSKRLPVDLHILRYREGSFIDSHTDPVDGRRHFRLNVEVRRAAKGGLFYAYPRSGIVAQGRRFVLFRPDVATHGVTEIKRGTRYVLSLGWAIGKESS